jgi:hypothetical protein
VTGRALRLVADGPRQVQRFAHWGIALSHHLSGVRIAAEPLNDVAFPIGGAIAGIHRIEGGLLVHVLGMPRAKPQEILRRRVEGHALRREFALNPLAEQGQDLVGRIVADGQGAIHHQAGLREYFALRIGFENAPARISGRQCGDYEHRAERQVDSSQQTHAAATAHFIGNSARPCG